uniref:Uncharacterized protein n=1 Tax=Lepeophtheirus salmonis TaxID=72036 RepID=A0A0K2UNL0_LEPSM
MNQFITSESNVVTRGYATFEQLLFSKYITFIYVYIYIMIKKMSKISHDKITCP